MAEGFSSRFANDIFDGISAFNNIMRFCHVALQMRLCAETLRADLEV